MQKVAISTQRKEKIIASRVPVCTLQMLVREKQAGYSKYLSQGLVGYTAGEKPGRNIS